jgi:hypothetical protein
MRLPDCKAMYADAAKGWGRGTLRCAECGRTQPCSEEQAAGYLSHGWPKCCDYTMTHEAAKEPSNG